MIYLTVVVCVLGIVVGQMMFKWSANEFVNSGTYLSLKPIFILTSAMLLYAITTIAWVWVLQRIDLGRVYPFMALAFVLVPIGSYLIFGERFQPQYLVGVILIVLGIIITVRS